MTRCKAIIQQYLLNKVYFFIFTEYKLSRKNATKFQFPLTLHPFQQIEKFHIPVFKGTATLMFSMN